MQALVVYYSRTGNTKKVGEDISAELHCDAEEIVDTADRSGPVGFVMSGRQATLKELTKIEPLQKDPSKYDLVIIGTPVWAFTMSAPVRTYILDHREKFKKVAFFITLGNIGAESTLKDLAELCAKPAEGTLIVKVRDISKEDYKDNLKKFIGVLGK